MKKTDFIIEKILKKPVTDHVVICYGKSETQHIRFSNNSVNRENLFKLEEEIKAEVGYDGRTGSYRTNDLSEDGIKHAVKKAYEAAKLLPKDPEYMPPVTQGEAEAIKHFKPVFGKLSDSKKYGILRHAFKELKKAGLNSAGSLSTNPYTVEVYNNKGVHASHINCFSTLALTAMTDNSSFKDSHISKDFSDYDGEAFLSNVISRARLSKNPATLEAGKYTVVLGPAAVEELLMMFLWYNMDAKAIDEGRSALSKRLNERIAEKAIHIYSKPDHAKISMSPFSPDDAIAMGRAESVIDIHIAKLREAGAKGFDLFGIGFEFAAVFQFHFAFFFNVEAQIFKQDNIAGLGFRAGRFDFRADTVIEKLHRLAEQFGERIGDGLK